MIAVWSADIPRMVFSKFALFCLQTWVMFSFAEVRPVTPPNDEKCPSEEKCGPAADSRPTRVPERKITVANTDLLFKLFENIDKDSAKRSMPQTTSFKRGR